MRFFESRCFPRTRDNVQKLLQDLGLEYYDPYLICLKTNGRMTNDHFWIRFKGDKRKYEDFK